MRIIFWVVGSANSGIASSSFLEPQEGSLSACRFRDEEEECADGAQGSVVHAWGHPVDREVDSGTLQRPLVQAGPLGNLLTVLRCGAHLAGRR